MLPLAHVNDVIDFSKTFSRLKVLLKVVLVDAKGVCGTITVFVAQVKAGPDVDDPYNGFEDPEAAETIACACPV